MASKDDATILVGTVGENGKLVSVRRYRTREAAIAEQCIEQLLEVGKRLRVSFIERADGSGLSDEVREHLAGLVPG